MVKEIFIVSSKEGAKVVSARVLANDVREVLKKHGTEYKRCDVESITNDAIRDNIAKVFDEPIYQELVEHLAVAIEEFTHLTPYQYMKQLPW